MDFQKEELNKLPHSPGVYQFKDRSGTIIYVGKAINLVKRVGSYFRDADSNLKTSLLRTQIETCSVIATTSEFDAVLLESELIRKFQPKFNIIAKDDKSPLYIRITLSDLLPRITFLRKSALGSEKHLDVIIGPFQSARTARRLISFIRHAIPFCLQKKRDGTPCFYTHLGLCQPCPSEIVKISDQSKKSYLTRLYRKNIYRLVHVLRGKSKEVISDLEKSMNRHADKGEYETAALIKKQLESLRSIHTRHHDPVAYEHIRQADEFNTELDDLRFILKPYYPDCPALTRIECIDISNLAGTLATGSLVVLLRGFPASDEYRKFRIRTKPIPDDAAMVAEVLTRRLQHPEWPMPDLLVIDGGKPQVRQASSVLAETGSTIPVIGLAKRFEEIVVPVGESFSVVRLPLDRKALHVIQRIRDEAHRFAKSYHLKLRSKLYRKITIV